MPKRRTKCSTLRTEELDEICGYESVPGRLHWVRVLFRVADPIDIPAAAWADLSLKVGLKVDEGRHADLLHAAAFAEARELALRYLHFRPRTAHEVHRHLVSKQVEPTLAGSVVQDLIQNALLGDETYAAHFYAAKQENWSRAQIRWKLQGRGIQPELSRAVVDTEEARLAESATALRLAAKIWRSSAGLAVDKRRQRLIATLRRRGFPNPIIRTAVREVILEDQTWSDNGIDETDRVAEDAFLSEEDLFTED